MELHYSCKINSKQIHNENRRGINCMRSINKDSSSIAYLKIC